MADETMSLRLPKPLLGNEIRSDFLNFSPDRRWDLLGFIKSDEVEEIKSCDVGPDGHRYYLVHWKDSWKPESSLVYCEKSLQDFWSKRSMLHDSDVITQTLAPSDITHNLARPDITDSLVPCENSNSLTTCDSSTQSLSTSYITHIMASPDISQTMITCDKLNIIECREHTIESTINDKIFGNHRDDNQDMDTIPASDDILDDDDDDRTTMGQGCTDYPSKDKLTRSSDNIFSSEHMAQKDASFVVVIDSSESPHMQSCDQTCDIMNISTETLEEIPAHLQINEINNLVENHNTVAGHNRDIITESVSNAEDNDVECIHQMQLSTSDISSVTGNTNNDIDSPSKKGAPKRKARPPRQSMHSLGTKACLAKKKEKIKKAKEKIKRIKEKSKGPKILKSVSTIINSQTTNESGESGDIIEESGGCATNNLKCMVCAKLLSSQQSLMKHLLTHNNNHTCPICHKTFKSTHFLRHHMDIHNASYQYSCPMCDKKFKFKNNMHGHIRKHNMEKKFECEVCHKKFIGRYNLKEHMKSHSDSRPYACDFCTKAYKDRGALNKHLLTHQEKKSRM